MSIIIYSKPDCVQCNATYRALDKHGIAYHVVDLTQDAQALGQVRAMGYQQVPVIVAGDDHWSVSAQIKSPPCANFRTRSED